MPHHALDTITRRSRDTGIRRGMTGRWVAGVCLGLGTRFGMDPVLFRVGFILLTLFGGVGIPLYLLAWLLLPTDDDDMPLARALRGDGAAITLLVLTVVVLAGTLFGRPNGATLVGILMTVGIAWWLTRRDRTPPMAATPESAGSAEWARSAEGAEGAWSAGSAAPWGAAPSPGPSSPPPGPAGASSDAAGASSDPARPMPVIGPMRAPAPVSPAGAVPAGPLDHAPARELDPGLVPAPDPVARAERRRRRRGSWAITVLAAGLALLAHTGVAAATAGTGHAALYAGAAALTVLGLALVLAGARGHRAPLVTVAVWLLGIGLLAEGPTPGSAAGDVAWHPRTAAQVQSVYEGGAGDADLDLRDLPVAATAASIGSPPPPRELEIRHGAGDLTVHLPAGVSAQIRAEVGAGSLYLSEDGPRHRIADGVGVTHRTTVGRGPLVYVLSLRVGAGDIVIAVDDTPAPAAPPATTALGAPAASPTVSTPWTVSPTTPATTPSTAGGTSAPPSPRPEHPSAPAVTRTEGVAA